jgi:hypothetical protein
MPVWLRKERSAPSIPRRDPGQTALLGAALGSAALAILAAFTVLRIADSIHGAWTPLLAAAFWCATAGLVGSLVALRRPVARRRAAWALLLTGPAFVGALVLPSLLPS